jgi:hypothetical protein
MRRINDSIRVFPFKRKLKSIFSRAPLPVNPSNNPYPPTAEDTTPRSTDAIFQSNQDFVAGADTQVETSPDPGQSGAADPAPISAPANDSNTWYNAVKLTLETFEKTLSSVPVPGLKGAIGGVLKIMDQFEVHTYSDVWLRNQLTVKILAEIGTE